MTKLDELVKEVWIGIERDSPAVYKILHSTNADARKVREVLIKEGIIKGMHTARELIKVTKIIGGKGKWWRN